MKQIKKQMARGLHDAATDEPFELFISQTDVRWCYYRDTRAAASPSSASARAGREPFRDARRGS